MYYLHCWENGVLQLSRQSYTLKVSSFDPGQQQFSSFRAIHVLALQEKIINIILYYYNYSYFYIYKLEKKFS